MVLLLFSIYLWNFYVSLLRSFVFSSAPSMFKNIFQSFWHLCNHDLGIFCFLICIQFEIFLFLDDFLWWVSFDRRLEIWVLCYMTFRFYFQSILPGSFDIALIPGRSSSPVSPLVTPEELGLLVTAGWRWDRLTPTCCCC